MKGIYTYQINDKWAEKIPTEGKEMRRLIFNQALDPLVLTEHIPIALTEIQKYGFVIENIIEDQLLPIDVPWKLLSTRLEFGPPYINGFFPYQPE